MVTRSQVVEQLREMGRHADAERALAELPDRVHLRELEAQLRTYGVDTSVLAMKHALWIGIGGGHGASSA